MKGLWLEDQGLSIKTDLPVPVLDEGEVLIKVLLAGVCSTDLELLRGYYPFTGIPGHEFVGIVVDANGHGEFDGERVIGDINISCGICQACLREERSQCSHRRTLGIHDYDGVFAEYTKLPARNLSIVPDSVSDVLATFTEPAAAALRILEQVQLKPSQKVIVVGAGRLGLLIAQVLKNTGCDLQVVVRRKEPAEILHNLGIRSIYAQDCRQEQADVVIEVTGSPDGFALSRKLVRPRGIMVLKSTFAGDVSVNLSKLVVDEITLIGSRCGNIAAGLRALESGILQVGEMVDSIYKLDEAAQALSHAAQPGVLKVFIKP